MLPILNDEHRDLILLKINPVRGWVKGNLELFGKGSEIFQENSHLLPQLHLLHDEH